MAKKKNKGRPKGTPTTAVTFRADTTVLEAIEKLSLALSGTGMAPGSMRAVAIRRAILNAAQSIEEDNDIDVVPLAESSQHPNCVIEGFIRDDMALEYETLPPGEPFEIGTVFLRQGVKPVVGAYVKMQVNCKPEWQQEFEQHVTYALMGGNVTRIEDGHVFASVEVTNMPAPVALGGPPWEVELVLEEDMAHPWVMVAMRKPMAN